MRLNGGWGWRQRALSNSNADRRRALEKKKKKKIPTRKMGGNERDGEQRVQRNVRYTQGRETGAHTPAFLICSSRFSPLRISGLDYALASTTKSPKCSGERQEQSPGPDVGNE